MRTGSWVKGALVGALAVALAPSTALAAPDAWVTAKTKMALYTADGVHGTDINVDTIDGRVTLHGVVRSDAEKAKAAEIARGIEGAKEVRNLLQVVPASAREKVTATDGELRDRVSKALADDRSLADSSIRVQSVNDGLVLLTGEAKSATDHLEALRTARAIPGVRRVESQVKSPDAFTDQELRARPMAESERDDGASVAARMKEGAEGAAGAVAAGAKGAAETLKEGAQATGRAITGDDEDARAAKARHADADAADARARTEDMDADDEAQYGLGDAASDMWITSATKLRLMADGDTPALDINVDTRDGVVTLFGIVPSEEAKRAAEANARKVGGVKSVTNELQVVATAKRDAVEKSDAELQSAIEKSLEERGGLEDADVTVEVSNGVARLTGTVASEMDRLEAATVARSTAGVRAVVQDLRKEPAPAAQTGENN